MEKLADAARELVDKYDRLYLQMDCDYAAFFTALSQEVNALRIILGLKKTAKESELDDL